MATAAIGPGFITQTTVFTGQLYTNFGFAILVSVLLDVVVQLNIWRIVYTTGSYAPVLANRAVPGLGYLLALLVGAGGLVFNIANIGGTGLGLEVLLGLPPHWGALLSAALAIVVFSFGLSGRGMDWFNKVLGIVMLMLMVVVCMVARPPAADIVQHTFVPQKIDVGAILTLVGGTVGGYISFSGAHRLLDVGGSRPGNLQAVQKSAVSGILLTSIMRFLLFATVAGVVATGVVLPAVNPAAFVFENAAGTMGLKIFGVILWCAAITSVVGASYTSVSFVAAVLPAVHRRRSLFVVVFIVASLAGFLLLGKATQLLVWAGLLNGMVLPLALAAMLYVAYTNRQNQGLPAHPGWLTLAGWLVVFAMAGMAFYTLYQKFA
jgi:Mn2+/Fe2+ NRAMP family transporter